MDNLVCVCVCVLTAVADNAVNRGDLCVHVTTQTRIRETVCDSLSVFFLDIDWLRGTSHFNKEKHSVCCSWISKHSRSDY